MSKVPKESDKASQALKHSHIAALSFVKCTPSIVQRPIFQTEPLYFGQAYRSCAKSTRFQTKSRTGTRLAEKGGGWHARTENPGGRGIPRKHLPWQATPQNFPFRDPRNSWGGAAHEHIVLSAIPRPDARRDITKAGKARRRCHSSLRRLSAACRSTGRPRARAEHPLRWYRLSPLCMRRLGHLMRKLMPRFKLMTVTTKPNARRICHTKS